MLQTRGDPHDDDAAAPVGECRDVLGEFLDTVRVTQLVRGPLGVKPLPLGQLQESRRAVGAQLRPYGFEIQLWHSRSIPDLPAPVRVPSSRRPLRVIARTTKRGPAACTTRPGWSCCRAEPAKRAGRSASSTGAHAPIGPGACSRSAAICTRARAPSVTAFLDDLPRMQARPEHRLNLPRPACVTRPAARACIGSCSLRPHKSAAKVSSLRDDGPCSKIARMYSLMSLMPCARSTDGRKRPASPALRWNRAAASAETTPRSQHSGCPAPPTSALHTRLTICTRYKPCFLKQRSSTPMPLTACYGLLSKPLARRSGFWNPSRQERIRRCLKRACRGSFFLIGGRRAELG
ncbi:hypothetical protein SCNRRL3882_0082 [Streptomyces chartreusis NRRL 3882]|uniref:Uncharacterized protein n=1 Tax=Streptomyces chartreusis NRRL 3882 TaxID=1079985 RepID=A0A2N9AZU9_STRCX|nr:hypothetical protein SCNRRL3882_0082 [Streptomyces chartreusis NRRL 3882]